jgi:hypothetical protein
MHYQHLVQVNDPLDPRIEPLGRRRLWRGLVVRVEHPGHFLIGLDECRIVNRAGNSLQRELRFGSAVVRDRVTLEPPTLVRYEVEPFGPVAGASLVIRIEEPQPGQLFLRFEYELQNRPGDADSELDEYRKSAYREADIDTVRQIRQLAATGMLAGDDEGSLEFH